MKKPTFRSSVFSCLSVFFIFCLLSVVLDHHELVFMKRYLNEVYEMPRLSRLPIT